MMFQGMYSMLSNSKSSKLNSDHLAFRIFIIEQYHFAFWRISKSMCLWHNEHLVINSSYKLNHGTHACWISAVSVMDNGYLFSEIVL